MTTECAIIWLTWRMAVTTSKAKTTKPKSEKPEFEHFDSVAKMSPAQYWEWRTTVEEMNHAETKLKLKELEIKISDREAAIIDRERKIKSIQLQKLNENRDKIKSDYKVFQENLEKKLNVNLTDTVICPYTTR